MSSDESDFELSDEEKQEVEDLSEPKVVTKYQAAAKIANEAVKDVMSKAVAGAVIVDLCVAGDAFITEATGKIYNKPKLDKGVAFPTCISVNNVVGHFCPLSGDTNTIAEGDLVKIDLGVQIDGYIAVIAHTFQVGGGPITGRKADVLKAAWTAAECAQRLLKPGRKNAEISDVITKVAAEFKCTPVQGVISHQMLRHVIDGEKVILNKPDAENKVEEIEFEPLEVYAMDIVMSTGNGKAKQSQDRTTVYKRALDSTYRLKMQASRQTLHQIDKRFSTFPFTLRALPDEKKARFGIVELHNHHLVDPYPVLYEDAEEFVAHIKFTVLIMPNSTNRITGDGLVDINSVQSEFKVTDKEVNKVLQMSKTGKKKKKKKKKKKN